MMGTRIELKTYDNWSSDALWAEWQRLRKIHSSLYEDIRRLRLNEREVRIAYGEESLAVVCAEVATTEVGIELEVVSAKLNWTFALYREARKREIELAERAAAQAGSESWT